MGNQAGSFEYDVGDEVEWPSGSPIWALHDGTAKADKSPVSVFVFDKDAPGADALLPLAQNAVDRLKKTRHPNVLAFLQTAETPKQLLMVTEPVTPLDLASDAARDDNAVALGLTALTTALEFLNTAVGVVHGNVNPSSIFVTKSGDWKLGGMELAAEANDGSLLSRAALLPSTAKYRAPALVGGNATVVARAPPTALDMYSVGALIHALYNGDAFSSGDDLRATTGAIPRLLVPTYRKLVAPSPANRPDPAAFRETGFFVSDFMELNDFLDNITIKSDGEKAMFYERLNESVDDLPPAFCAHKVVPALLTALEYGTPDAKVLTPLLRVSQHLDGDQFSDLVVPVMVKMFKLPDPKIRMNLLANMEHFAVHLSDRLVEDEIYPAVSAGFNHEHPLMREATIKSMIHLVPKLRDRTVNSNVLSHLARMQQDPQEFIRVNTTVCLARLADGLAAATQKKVLVAAFSRAMRDPAPAARRAGVKALLHTRHIFDGPTAATKVIPALAARTVDPEKAVRDQALGVLRVYVDFVAEYAAAMPETAEEAAAAATNRSLMTNALGKTASSASSWTGWAVSSLSKKIYGGGSGSGGGNGGGGNGSGAGGDDDGTLPVDGDTAADPGAGRVDDKAGGSAALPGSSPTSEADDGDGWGGFDDDAWDNDEPADGGGSGNRLGLAGGDSAESDGGNGWGDMDGWGDDDDDDDDDDDNTVGAFGASRTKAKAAKRGGMTLGGKKGGAGATTTKTRTRKAAPAADDDWAALLNSPSPSEPTTTATALPAVADGNLPTVDLDEWNKDLVDDEWGDMDDGWGEDGASGKQKKKKAARKKADDPTIKPVALVFGGTVPVEEPATQVKEISGLNWGGGDGDDGNDDDAGGWGVGGWGDGSDDDDGSDDAGADVWGALDDEPVASPPPKASLKLGTSGGLSKLELRAQKKAERERKRAERLAAREAKRKAGN